MASDNIEETFKYRTPLCYEEWKISPREVASRARRGKMGLELLSEEQIIDLLRDIPETLLIGVCDSLSAFGTIAVACSRGWLRVLAYLLANIPEKIQITALNIAHRYRSHSPLQSAIYGGHTECIPVLLEMHPHIYAPYFSNMFYGEEQHFIRLEMFDDFMACKPFVTDEVMTRTLAGLIHFCVLLHSENVSKWTSEFVRQVLSACVVEYPKILTTNVFREEQSDYHYTPFMTVCCELRLYFTKFLIDKQLVTNADIDAMIGAPRNVLHILAQNGERFDPDVYTERVHFLASLQPKWLRERNSSGDTPAEIEERTNVHQTLQLMSNPAVKGAM